MIHGRLILALLGRMPSGIAREDLRHLLSNSVKHGGLAIRDPVASVSRARIYLVAAGEVLTALLLAAGELNSAAHR